MLRGIGEDGGDATDDEAAALSLDDGELPWPVEQEEIEQESGEKRVGGREQRLLVTRTLPAAAARCVITTFAHLPRMPCPPPPRPPQDAIADKTPAQMQDIAAREGYGPLFCAFGSVAEGLYACDAVDSLVDASAIDTLLSNFIVPLQSDDISKPDAAGGWAGGLVGVGVAGVVVLLVAVVVGVVGVDGLCVSATWPVLARQRRGEEGVRRGCSRRCRAPVTAAACRSPACPPTPPPQACTACTAPSTSTPRRGACLRGAPTCRTSPRWRRIGTRWAAGGGGVCGGVVWGWCVGGLAQPERERMCVSVC